MSDKDTLVELLARYAYQEGEFELSSGARSTFYLDAKQVTYRADGGKLVGETVYQVVRELGAEAVGGLTLGADAIVANTVRASAGDQRPISGFVVRKQAKQHGLQKWIEGIDPRDKRVVIVEDVITSGDSALKAAQHARDAGATVVAIVALVDREQGARDRIRDANIEFRPLCTLTDVRDARARAGSAHMSKVGRG
jgi:orotate phosphoribosyltransferase